MLILCNWQHDLLDILEEEPSSVDRTLLCYAVQVKLSRTNPALLRVAMRMAQYEVALLVNAMSNIGFIPFPHQEMTVA